MRFPNECYQMQQQIAHYFPKLSPAQQRGLVLWTYGTILAKSACQSAVVAALMVCGSFNTIRQNIRQWLYDGKDKARPCKSQLEVSLCFGPLMRWVLSWWEAEQIALAVDVTNHGDRLVAVVVSVLYRGCAIPVGWHIQPANQPGAYMPHILRLLKVVLAQVGEEMRVLVMADRGLWSPQMWKQIGALGAHPLIRVQRNVYFQPQGARMVKARHLISGSGQGWIGAGRVFKPKELKLDGTLMVVWEEDQAELWIVLSDLPPSDIGVSWYGLRMWIELGFKALKGVGWKWNKTRRTDPERVARHWLVLAVATLWVMAYGSRAEDAASMGMEPGRLREPAELREDIRREISVFQQGISWMTRHLIKGRLWKRLWLKPGIWPSPSSTLKLIYHEFT